MARKKTTETKRPIESYEHQGKQRVNNPPVGLVTPETDPDAGAKKTYAYDPHVQWPGILRSMCPRCRCPSSLASTGAWPSRSWTTGASRA